MQTEIRRLLEEAGARGASADEIVVILALLALADESGKARVYATEIAQLARLSKRRLLVALDALPRLAVEVETSGKKGAKSCYDLSAWITREGSPRSFSTREGSPRSFSEKDHSDLSRAEKDRPDPSPRKIAPILLDGSTRSEKDRPDPSRRGARKIAPILLDAEKDRPDLSSRAGERAGAPAPPPPPSLASGGGARGQTGEAREALRGEARQGAKNEQRATRPVEALQGSGGYIEPRGDEKRASVQNRAALARIEEEDLERAERRRQAGETMRREDLPLDAWLEGCFGVYDRAITLAGLTGLASQLLAYLSPGDARLYVQERFLKHEAGADRVSDREFVKYLLRDVPEWAAQRRAAAAALPTAPETLPRVVMPTETTETPTRDLSDYRQKSKLH